MMGGTRTGGTIVTHTRAMPTQANLVQGIGATMEAQPTGIVVQVSTNCELFASVCFYNNY